MGPAPPQWGLLIGHPYFATARHLPVSTMFHRIREFMSGRLLLPLAALLILAAMLWAFRVPVMRGMGTYLITPDDLVASDAIYVLGGSPLERGAEGARLWAAGVAPVVVCTGSNVPSALTAVGAERTEAELSRDVALAHGADADAVELLQVGTSTWEEAEAVLQHARMQGHTNIVVVSTEFHLRRVRRVFRKHFAGSGITVRVHGAASLVYDPARWWTSEEGLLMVNNEYVKLLYYQLKY